MAKVQLVASIVMVVCFVGGHMWRMPTWVIVAYWLSILLSARDALAALRQPRRGAPSGRGDA